MRWCLHQRDQPTVAHRKPHPVRHSGEGRNQNPRLLLQLAPSAAARPVPHHTPHWVPACAGTIGWTAGASSPLACRYDGLDDPCIHGIEVPAPPPPTASPHLVIPAKAGIQNPPTIATRPRCCTSGCLITRRTGTGLRRYDGLGRLVPLRRCLAGMTGWSAGTPFSVACWHDALDDPCIHGIEVPAPPRPPPQAPPSSFRRRPESRTHAYYSNSPRTPLHVRCLITRALGTGLRRYDG